MSQPDIDLCPCYSGKAFSTCCQPFLNKVKSPDSSMQLMRSRYTAYALGLADYIIETTHLLNPNYESNQEKWILSIKQFSQNTSFENLEILDYIREGDKEMVTFTAFLTQDSVNVSFTEKSLFEKVSGQWLYLDAAFITKYKI